MSKLSDKNIGNILRLQIENGFYCYARILGQLDFVFYDYKTNFKDDDLNQIIQKDILFSALVSFNAIKQGNWEIIGKLPLDERHKIRPIYFHPYLMNANIIAFTKEKIEKTMQYKTFEKRGIQDGGIYSAINIIQRLKDYFNGQDYEGITALLKMLENLKGTQLPKCSS